MQEITVMFATRGKLMLITLCICASAVIIWLFAHTFFPGLWDMFKPNNELEIADYLHTQGRWKGILCAFVMSFVQLVSIVLPANLIQIASGLIFPWWLAFIACFLGFIAANAAVFLLANKVGRKIQNHFIKSPAAVRLIKKLHTGDPVIIIALAILLPGIPKGIVPYIAASMDIPFKSFMFAISSVSWIRILLNCTAGYLFIHGNYIFSVLFVLAELLISFVVYKTGDKISDTAHRLTGRGQQN